MYEIADELNTVLESKHRIVYIADDFCWKELALEQLKGRDDIEIIENSEVLELYRMYEFSDRFIVLEESCQYGSIWNYVRKGLITAEEALACCVGNADATLGI